MSHASLIVALSPEQIAAHDGDVREAVSQQMAPFDENGEWFRDGSRWDWWQIGGRFTGLLDPAYDPATDPQNIKTCEFCEGSGRRDDAIGRKTRRKDPTFTCNGCAGSGKRVKWPTEWAPFAGDVKRRGELAEPPMAASAFLKDRTWHENTRMGWFGTTTSTECAIKSLEETGEEYSGRCLHTCPQTGARVVSWGDDGDRWDRLFWPRFLRNLEAETTLVVVDYHV